ncbi:hypothetical protein [Arthrobacter sp. V1I9]|uniref:hypothetical protein n=1 Tax=Arthrobacter sp. V1I9 TaxID=3042275 RepID=UPI0027D80C3E|nr:hypothetical protein [Arthrobacter sp. V1I9]
MVLIPLVSIWIAILVLRSVLIILAGVMAMVALMVSGKVKLASDALAWCSDETFRETVIKDCERRVARANADATILVGHSQGGSILTEMVRNQTKPRKNQSLITLGSGQAILATLYEARSHPMLIWLTAIGAALTMFLLFFGLLLAPSQLALRGLIWMGTAVSAVVQNLWAWPLADAFRVDTTYRALADQTRLFADDNFRGAIVSLTEPQLIPPIEILLPIALYNGLLYLLIVLVVVPTGRAIMERTRANVEGRDLSANRDLVSKPLEVMGLPTRVVRIEQTGRLMLDHTSYLQNRVSVMPVIARQIDNFARRHPAPSIDILDADYEHRQQLWVLRPFQWLFGLSLVLNLSFASPRLAIASAINFVAFCVISSLSLVYARHLLFRNSALGPTSEEAFLAKSGRARRARKSWRRALVLLVFAVPQAGSLITPYQGTWESWAAPAEAASLASAVPAGTGAFFTLTFSALLFVRGSQIAKPVSVMALCLSAQVVLLMGTPMAFWIAALHFVPLIWTCWPHHRTFERGAGEDVHATSSPQEMAEQHQAGSRAFPQSETVR